MLELCSGCGGMSLGFHRAGYTLSAHVESDPTAVATFAENFAPSAAHAIWSRPLDMTTRSPADVVELFEPGAKPSDAFDVLAAGLPCQAFARIGRSKLRSISGDDRAFKNDPRATLYRRFLEYVRLTAPLAIVLENVPDILNFGGHNVPEEISHTLADLGYDSGYTLLNAAFFGVPQIRERLFLIAVHRSLGAAVAFPRPTHHASLPRGYEGSRRVALKHVPPDSRYFHPISEPSNALPEAIAARAALSDLPFISEPWSDPRAMRRRRVSERLAYRSVTAPTAYSTLMREWPGFREYADTDGHVVRLTPRDFPIFRDMPHGADYPRALEVAEALFEARLQALGLRLRPDSEEHHELRKAMIPPYDPSKFPNKWWKLDPDLPVRTLTAHMGKDTYSHIHYDGRQRRTISVREAARLQSFPDGFRFCGQMNAAFRQIGNAVPPLLALAVARKLLSTLRRSALAATAHAQTA
ncbi:MAG: DNA cytosine methyltransferase [Vicinamibacterales bacterium]